MEPIVLRAHAKVNLHLAVGARLPTGYHAVETVLQTLDWSDRLTFWADRDLTLSCTDPALETEDNLVLRAARQLRQRTGCDLGARIHLDKQLPIAAGIGGGSADAAAALIGLNQLWGLGLDIPELTAVAGELGADVPFLVRGGTGLATGIGQTLAPAVNRLDCYVIMAWPDRRLSVRDVYAEFDRVSTGKAGELRSADPLLRALDAGDLEAAGRSLHNDLEPAIWRLCPEARELKAGASATGAACLASGSGPAVYALAASYEQAVDIARALGPGAQTKVARFAPAGVSDDRRKAADVHIGAPRG